MVGANPEVEAAHARVREDDVAVRVSANQDHLILVVVIEYDEDALDNCVVLEHRQNWESGLVFLFWVLVFCHGGNGSH